MLPMRIASGQGTIIFKYLDISQKRYVICCFHDGEAMRPWAASIGASAALLAFYAVVMGLASSLSVMLAQLRSLWYLMLPLIAGFGLQVGLFVRMRERASPAGVAASGGGAGARVAAPC